MKPSGIITLATDFGIEDPYAGIMKGVILSINRNVSLIDLCHQLSPGNIFHAAVFIKESYSYYPKGTIHVVVVDPGVGSERRPILIETEDYFFIGPDNGVLWPAISEDQTMRIIHLTEKKYFLKKISSTFHGRDIFASASAHLSLGIDPLKMGNLIDDPVRINIPMPDEYKDRIVGEIIRIDHFGNIITNISLNNMFHIDELRYAIVRVENLIVEGIMNTYSDVDAGQCLALIGSNGCIELSVNKGRADYLLTDYMMDKKREIIGLSVEVKRKE